MEYFFTAEDAKFFASLGLNCVRIPINHRHFMDDLNPGVIKESGFHLIDRIVELCAAEGIYTILDLHTFPVNAGRKQDLSPRLTVPLRAGRTKDGIAIQGSTKPFSGISRTFRIVRSTCG